MEIGYLPLDKFVLCMQPRLETNNSSYRRHGRPLSSFSQLYDAAVRKWLNNHWLPQSLPVKSNHISVPPSNIRGRALISRFSLHPGLPGIFDVTSSSRSCLFFEYLGKWRCIKGGTVCRSISIVKGQKREKYAHYLFSARNV